MEMGSDSGKIYAAVVEIEAGAKHIADFAGNWCQVNYQNYQEGVAECLAITVDIDDRKIAFNAAFTVTEAGHNFLKDEMSDLKFPLSQSIMTNYERNRFYIDISNLAEDEVESHALRALHSAIMMHIESIMFFSSYQIDETDPDVSSIRHSADEWFNDLSNSRDYENACIHTVAVSP